MKSWLNGIWCVVRRHEVVKGEVCPVTGIQLLTCSKCGRNNMPKHSGSSYN